MIRSKRLKIAERAALINYIIFLIGLFMGANLIALGTGLSLLNAPVFAYIFGETFRKSSGKNTNE